MDVMERGEAGESVCAGCREWIDYRQEGKMSNAVDHEHKWATEFFLCKRCVVKIKALSPEANERYCRDLVNRMRAGENIYHAPRDYEEAVAKTDMQFYGANDE